MSEEMKTVSVAAVDRMMKALVGIIIDQDAIIARLTPNVGHSCDVVERQVFKLLDLAGRDTYLTSSTIQHIFSTDPADDPEWKDKQ